MEYLVILVLIVNILINLVIIMNWSISISTISYYRWYRFNDYPNQYESWWGFANRPNVDELNP